MQVSNPNGPPHPFQHQSANGNKKLNSSFKPQRAASSIPTDIASKCQKAPKCQWQQKTEFQFQTPTGRLIHSNLSPGTWNVASDVVSNPNGPPHPFQLANVRRFFPLIGLFQTPTGRLIHSNLDDGPINRRWRHRFKPQRAASSIPTWG